MVFETDTSLVTQSATRMRISAAVLRLNLARLSPDSPQPTLVEERFHSPRLRWRFRAFWGDIYRDRVFNIGRPLVSFRSYSDGRVNFLVGDEFGIRDNIVSWSLGQIAAPLPERKCRKYIKIYRKCSNLIANKCVKSFIGLGGYLLVIRSPSLALFANLIWCRGRSTNRSTIELDPADIIINEHNSFALRSKIVRNPKKRLIKRLIKKDLGRLYWGKR